jgi:hypothetical protein
MIKALLFCMNSAMCAFNVDKHSLGWAVWFGLMAVSNLVWLASDAISEAIKDSSCVK